MSVGALLWSSLRELVVAVGRRLIGKLLRRIAYRWALRRCRVLVDRLRRVRAVWRSEWIYARLKAWRRVVAWVEAREQQLTGEALCECSKIAKREGIPMDSPDDVEPKRAPRKAA
jgi:hypothetical protein